MRITKAKIALFFIILMLSKIKHREPFIPQYNEPQRKNKSKNHCVAFGCNSNYSKNNTTHLFRFPKEVNRCLEWVKNTGLKFLQGKSATSLNKNSRLCDQHFEESQFQNESKSTLKWNAVPTLFPTLPNQPPKIELKRKPPKERCSI